MDTLARDLRFAVRSLLKRPAMFGIAAVSLALGISANTTIFAAIGMWATIQSRASDQVRSGDSLVSETAGLSSSPAKEK